MGDVAKGVKSFKKGLADDDETPASAPTTAQRTIENRVGVVFGEPEGDLLAG